MKNFINWFYKTIFRYFFYLQDFEDAIYSTNLLFTLVMSITLLPFVFKIIMIVLNDFPYAISSISCLVFCYFVYRIVKFIANRYLINEISNIKPVERIVFIKGVILQISLLLISVVVFFVFFKFFVA